LFRSPLSRILAQSFFHREGPTEGKRIPPLSRITHYHARLRAKTVLHGRARSQLSRCCFEFLTVIIVIIKKRKTGKRERHTIDIYNRLNMPYSFSISRIGCSGTGRDKIFDCPFFRARMFVKKPYKKRLVIMAIVISSRAQFVQRQNFIARMIYLSHRSAENRHIYIVNIESIIYICVYIYIYIYIYIHIHISMESTR